ncbi:hypothetical protein AY599_03795 [Leptolyngbya valderiana BDU 20041]|nr:hypothetical protein AY599_03795 [Leptolyngbya valderiana BDU 20041]
MLTKTTARTRFRLRGPRPRWFGHPGTIALISALLIADYASIPGGYWRGGSTVKTTIEHLSGKWFGVMVSPRFFPGMYMQSGNEIELIWETVTPIPGQLTYGDLNQPGGRIDQSWNYLGRPAWRRNELRGFYHITHKQTSHSFDPRLTPAQTSRMMAIFIERSDSIPHTHDLAAFSSEFAEIRSLYAQGKTSERSHLPIGYLRNTIALTLLALLCLLPARGRTDLWLKAWKDRLLKRYPPGHCSHCGYDARGLETCPECGADLAT